MINLPSEKFKEGVFYLSNPDDYRAKEDLYLKVRVKEGRVYTDAEVKTLPNVNHTQKYNKEWKLRNVTAQKLLDFFSLFSHLDILDVGAGNCWLSNLISSRTENFVYAVDLNEYELKQGSRVFSGNKKLQFIYVNIFDEYFKDYKFDVIIFSSSIQYFSNFSDTIEKAFSLLQPDGYIMITDSKFYNGDEIIPAKERTAGYYKELGFPEASQNYFHHSFSDLNKFKFEILKDDSSFNKFLVLTGLKRTSPFPFIKIYRQ